MKKSYILDTNTLIEDPNCIQILRNGDDNNIIGIPFHVILELDKLKKEARLRHLVANAVESIRDNIEVIRILREDEEGELVGNNDLKILKEIHRSGIEEPILVTNDRIFQLIAKVCGVQSQEFKSSNPFQSDSQLYTGFVDNGDLVPNCFRWEEGKPAFYGNQGRKVIDYEHDVWRVRPRSVYQNLAYELLLDEDIDLVSLQSEAGYGKTYLALSAAFHQVLERKLFHKIYVVKPMIEIGEKMGFLPGDVEEKIEPYVKYLHALTGKLHRLRPANRIFIDPDASPVRYNPERFEVLPLAFIRGMNIEDAIVIVDETQNLSRNEIRALLTRMGENVKCYCLGDTRQVDNPYLNEANNALNWIVRKLRGTLNYGHLVLKGARSRGPICDAVLKAGL
jgi:PhoH-like ATPase